MSNGSEFLNNPEVEIPCKPKLKVVGEEGNAFAILGRASKAAKRAGWSPAQRIAVLEEGQSGDYDHLLATIMYYFDVDGEDAFDD